MEKTIEKRFVDQVMDVVYTYRRLNCEHPSTLRIGCEERKLLLSELDGDLRGCYVPSMRKEQFYGMDVIEDRFMRGFSVG